MKIAIVGSGISGLSFYLFLEKSGFAKNHDLKLYEARQPTDPTGETNAETYNASVIGASIGLAANGLKVLKSLDEGLADEVMRTGHELKYCELSTARGWVLADVPFGHTQETTLMIGRDDLWQCLKRRVPESVIVRKKVTKVEIEDESNTLVFSDGSKVEADLVVGADGIWSVVRGAIFDAEDGKGEYKYSPHYEGLVGTGGFVPRTYLKDDPQGKMVVVFGANGFFGYAYTDDQSSSSSAYHKDRAVWWSTYSLDECPEDWRNIDKHDVKKQLQSRHGTWKNETIQTIVRDPEVTSLYPMFTTPLLPTWERNGCVLVGDAAHALQPSSAQGGSMALEDSEALSLLLQHHLEKDPQKGHLVATKQYSELRKPRLGIVHKKAQETGAMKQDMGVFQEMMMYFFIWMINRLHLNNSYNRTILDYDGLSEVKKIIEAERSV